jgi:hypothetical protein
MKCHHLLFHFRTHLLLLLKGGEKSLSRATFSLCKFLMSPWKPPPFIAPLLESQNKEAHKKVIKCHTHIHMNMLSHLHEEF